MLVPTGKSSGTRGAFVVLEGIDRCGKTTQSALLVQKLLTAGLAACALRFPDRTTATGQLIDSYLQSSKHLDDRAVHLLFSANRWEAASDISTKLAAGTTIVCDRYAYSGVAFSAAKIDAHGNPKLSMEWCQAPDKGLPAPDCVIFLQLDQEEAERRGGYGGERYEQRDMQMRVRQRFADLQTLDDGRVPWHVVNAAQTIEQVQADIDSIVDETLKQVEQGKALPKLWEEGEYELTMPTTTSQDEKKEVD